MSKSILFRTAIIASVVMSANAYAFQVDNQPVTSYATITKPSLTEKVGGKKEVVLMNIKLSADEKRGIMQNITKARPVERITRDDLPASVDLGMNDIPVLDQGMHGTCVTFASTAAIDALVGKGDYISQLCNLELGRYLQNNGYVPDGWDGSLGPFILDQMMRFGYINQDNQKEKSCAGVTAYPLNDKNNTGKTMSLHDFRKMSENLVNDQGELKWAWIPFMNAFDRFSKQFQNIDDAENTLIKIKESLSQGKRVTFGTMIISSPDCGKAACAKYHAENDTWAITDGIKNDPQLLGGHEMVITGYDDNASAVDSDGNKHQGLLILRNSWSDDVGDKGTFYMSYEYFVNMVMEAQQIVSD